MEVVILCGGRGERLIEYTNKIPKSLVAIGDNPILWHIMSTFAHAGHTEFVLCLGYMGNELRRYFVDNGEVKSVESDGSMIVRYQGWTVRLVDTGQDTMTGGRLKRIEEVVEGDTFMATYGDCVSNVDLHQLAAVHREEGRIGTVTVVKPPPRFGVVQLDGKRLTAFTEKAPEDSPWISGGFFVFERKLFEFLSDDNEVLEAQPLSTLAGQGELSAFVHRGFWSCMDTLPDALRLNSQWAEGDRPWAIWEGR